MSSIVTLIVIAAAVVLGIALAYIGLQWLTASIPPANQVPYYIDWSMNPRVVVYTTAIAALTGVVFGLAPALQAARTNLQGALKEGGRGSGYQKSRLRSALSDSLVAVERRQQVVEDILKGKASPATIGAVSMIVGAGHAGDLPAIARAVVERSATMRNHAVAEVRSAVLLSADQRTRLAAALKKSTGKDVEIKVVIDPSVLGGIVTQIGDTVIDGSVRHRLNRVRETLG